MSVWFSGECRQNHSEPHAHGFTVETSKFTPDGGRALPATPGNQGTPPVDEEVGPLQRLGAGEQLEFVGVALSPVPSGCVKTGLDRIAIEPQSVVGQAAGVKKRFTFVQ